MKRLVKIFITALVIFCIGITANAQIDVQTENGADTVIISGTSDYMNMPAAVKIYNEKRKVYIDQIETETDGSFEFECRLPSGSTYNGKININGETQSFTLSTDAPNTGVPEEFDIIKISIKGYNNSSILTNYKVEIDKGESLSVLNVLKKACQDNDIDLVINNGYVSSIDGIAQFDHGSKSGWMFEINDEFPELSADNVDASSNDIVKWVYTTDLGTDVGNTYDGPEISDSSKVVEDAKKVIDNIEDYPDDEIDEIFDSLLKLEDNENEKLDTLEELTDRIIDNSGRYNVRGIKKEGNKVIANVDSNNLENIIKKVTSKIKDLNTKISDNNIKFKKEIQMKVTLNIETAGETEVKTNISRSAIKDIIKNEIKKLDIKTEIADININPEELSGEVSLTAKKLNRDELTDEMKNQVPEGAAVIDLDLEIDNQKKSKFTKPVKVSIPYDKEISDSEYVSVYYLNDNGKLEIIGGRYTPETKQVTFLTNHFSKFFADENIINFKDIERITWASKEIKAMASKGIISGKGDNIYKPDDNITRAEFAALICRMMKLSQQTQSINPFKDVKEESWYYEYVNTAYDNSLVNGKSAYIFDPEGEITRQEMAKITALIIKDEGYKLGDTKELKVFKDRDSIAKWANEYVAAAVRDGVIRGMEDGYFRPDSKATRAEAAVMLYRLFNIVY